MRKSINVLLMCLCLFQTDLAFAVDTSVFGIGLGERLSLPECDRLPGYDVSYENNSKYMCWKHTENSSLLAVRFPDGKSPNISDGTDLYLNLINSKVEGVSIQTAGPPTQSAVLEVLTNKYGKPTKIDSVVKNNAFGAVLNSIEASWDFPELSVMFSGVVKMNTGEVSVISRRLRFRLEREKKENEKELPRM